MELIANIIVILVASVAHIGQLFLKPISVTGGRPRAGISHLYATQNDKPDIPFFRTVDKIPGQSEYKDYDCTTYRHVHWGQLKLLLSEIEFLTIALNRYGWDSHPILIYPGAAPGHHTELLAKMFPQVTFHLYDQTEFVVRASKQIHLHKQYFLDKDAEFWRDYKRDQPILLCSDIRTSPVTDESIIADNELQLKWWQTIQPDLTIYKMRFPFTQGITEYPEGIRYLQAFPQGMSTECRLYIEKGAKMIQYNHADQEHKMAYHNQFLRGKAYHVFSQQNFDLKRDGVCNCYDCTTFIHIVNEYHKLNPDYDKSLKSVLKHAKYIQNHCVASCNLYKITLKNRANCRKDQKN
jgi:hypothetical protein